MRLFIVFILLSLSMFTEALLFQFLLFLCALLIYTYKDLILFIHSKIN